MMEFSIFVAFVVLLVLRGEVDPETAGQYFSFIVPEFQQHLGQLMVMSGIFGVLRIIGAVGLLKNRLWGLVLSAINCTVTLVLMIFMLPAGIADGLLSGAALVLILVGWFGQREINPVGTSL